MAAACVLLKLTTLPESEAPSFSITSSML